MIREGPAERFHVRPPDSYHKPCTCGELQSGSRELQAMPAIDIRVGYQLCAHSNNVKVEQVLWRFVSNVQYMARIPLNSSSGGQTPCITRYHRHPAPRSRSRFCNAGCLLYNTRTFSTPSSVSVHVYSMCAPRLQCKIAACARQDGRALRVARWYSKHAHANHTSLPGRPETNTTNRPTTGNRSDTSATLGRVFESIMCSGSCSQSWM
jgi:hypothetical protein